MRQPQRYTWLILAIAVTVWLAVSVFMMAVAYPDAPPRTPALLWIAAFGVYAGALLSSVVIARRWHTVQFTLIVIETVTVLAMAAMPGRGDPGPLLAPIALQVALLFETRTALAWAIGESILMWFPRWHFLSNGMSWLYWGLNVAAQIIAVGTVHVLRRDAETSEALSRINAELRATQALLADSVAAGERLRISRELHDAWGHDLTVLSLQLEYASHVPPEQARSSVVEARDLARSLFAKVRDVVGTLRRYEGHDIRPALEALAAEMPQLAVHLDIPDPLVLQPAETAQALVRSAQEIITNTLRHARARNLWLLVRTDGERVRFESRDDGEGTDRLALGHGLRGLRERFEQLGGKIVFETGRDEGFRALGWLPARPSQP